MNAMSQQQFDRLIKALTALKAAYMRERDPKRSCQIYVKGHWMALRVLTASGLSGLMKYQAANFFDSQERSATCHYLLKLWAGIDPWEGSK